MLEKSLVNQLKALDMGFYKQMMRVPWVEHESNKEILKENETKKTIILKKRVKISETHYEERALWKD